MPRLHRTLAAALIAGCLAAGMAMAEADGPDFFRVTGVAADDVLNMRAGPGTEHPVIGAIPPDADGLRNLGCTGGLSFAEWEKASPAEREAAARTRWCRVAHEGAEGWVAARFLAEGTAPTAPDAPAMEGTVWRLVGSPAGPAIGEAFVAFAPDASVSGSSGCNSFRARGSFGPGTFSVEGPIAATRRFCAEPGLMAQEDALFSALSRAARFEFDLRTGRLRIMDRSDALMLDLVLERGR